VVTERVVVGVTVGLVVVVVVAAGALLVDESFDDDEEEVAVDDDAVEGVVVAVEVEAAVELAPGCSFATTTPTSAVALAAPSTDIRVRRRSRT
jgi:hypothetical protein